MCCFVTWLMWSTSPSNVVTVVGLPFFDPWLIRTTKTAVNIDLIHGDRDHVIVLMSLSVFTYRDQYGVADRGRPVASMWSSEADDREPDTPTSIDRSPSLAPRWESVRQQCRELWSPPSSSSSNETPQWSSRPWSIMVDKVNHPLDN